MTLSNHPQCLPVNSPTVVLPLLPVAVIHSIGVASVMPDVVTDADSLYVIQKEAKQLSKTDV
jgi:hypothetical protein